MENIVLVGLGYNEAFMPIGAFNSQQEAEEALLAAGCARKRFPRRFYNKATKAMESTGEFGPEHIVITPAFRNWMHEHNFNFYSVGGVCDDDVHFTFQTFPVGSISHGYDDD